MIRSVSPTSCRQRSWRIPLKRTAALAGAVAIAAALLGGVPMAKAGATGGPSLLPSEGQFVSVPIVRVLDTRYGTGGVPAEPIASGGTVTFPVAGVFGVPSTADSVVLDITALNTVSSGYLTVYNADESDPGVAAVGMRPTHMTNQTATVSVSSSGTVSLTNHGSGATDVVASVVGYYAGAGQTSPGDTYFGLPWTELGGATTIPADSSATFQVTGSAGIPAGADTAVLQVNAYDATVAGYLTAYAAGSPDPGISALGYDTDTFYRNLLYVPLSSSGQISLTNYSSGAVTVTLWPRGYYTPPATTPAGGQYSALDQEMVYGTASSGAPLAANTSVTFQVTGTGDIPTAEVAAVTEDVVATNPATIGNLAEGPADGATRPVVSFLGADQTAFTGYDNGLVSTLSPSGEETITNDSSGTVDVQVDVTGWFEAPVEPGEPLGVSATVTGSSATITWAAPIDDGGSPVTGYTVAASPDTASVQVGQGTYQATLSGLSQAATDTFTVTATNAVGLGMPGEASSDTCIPIDSTSFSDSDTADSEAYWTDAEIASATDFNTAPTNTAVDDALEADQVPAGSPLSATGDCPAIPQGATSTDAATILDAAAASHPISGYPSVGKLFFKVAGVGNANCTATVINDANSNPKESLVLTAAHCVEPAAMCTILPFSHYMFAPQWTNSHPYPDGKWYPEHIYVPHNWLSRNDFGCWSENPRYDYAVLIMRQQKDASGVLRGIGYYTGENGWAYSMPARKNVRIVGIPGDDPKPLQVITESTTIKDCNVQNRTASTPGFSSGSSGGPWFYSFNKSQQIGRLIGIVSGCNNGGPDDNTSYSAVWHADYGAFVAYVASKE
jgi:Fibronectin type III domain